MWSRIRNFFAEACESWPNNHRQAAREAARLAACESSSTTIFLADVGYLPLGGTDRIVLRLLPRGGHIERTRTPYEQPTVRIERELPEQEADRVRAQLHRYDVWNLGDHRESVVDGLVCGFAVAKGEQVHSFQLHCVSNDSLHLQILDFLTGLVPIEESVVYGGVSHVGEIDIRERE